MLIDHKNWIRKKPYGVRADFGNANLPNMNFRKADFRGANLTDATLTNLIGDMVY